MLYGNGSKPRSMNTTQAKCFPRRAEQHTRKPEGLWLLREIVGIEAVIQLASLDSSLAMKDVYDKVDFQVEEEQSQSSLGLG